MSGDLVFTLPPEALEQIANQVAEILAMARAQPAARRWLTVAEAAELARCSAQRIYNLRSSGALSRTGDGGRALVDRDELDELIRRGGVR
jgi:excisionase family DNA binding protein